MNFYTYSWKIRLFYLKLKYAQKYPLRLVGKNDVCPKSYQNPFISWGFGPIWTHLAPQKIEADFSPLLIYSPGYGQKMFSKTIRKNYFSQVFGHKFGQICNKWGQFGQNRSFLVKMVKIGSFWHIFRSNMTSYVEIRGQWSSNFFPKCF